MSPRHLLPFVFVVLGACSRAPAQEVDAGITAVALPEQEPAPFVPAPTLESLDASVASRFDSPGPSRPVTFTDPAGAAVFAFGAELHSALRSKEGSFVVSPLSIAGALAMTHAGARGETAAEIARALHLGPNVSGASLATLERGTPFAKRSSAIFAGRAVSETYRDTIRRDFFGEVMALDFSTDPAGARAQINRWTHEKTAKGFPELLDTSAINGLTALVLVDALVAAGTWTAPFDLEKTSPQPFERASGARVVVPTMWSRAERRAWHTASYDAVEIPCDRERALVVIAPQQGTLASFERALTADRMREILGELVPRDVELSLPRFSVRNVFDARIVLRALGIRRAFEIGADLSAMTSMGTYVERVVHGAGIDVDERGVKAAAATAVVTQKAAARPAPLVLRVDRPFVFILSNTKTGVPLVMGRYAGP